MNRTDRLLAIVLELQARGHRRAEDLAATFETSKRTIYRDIQALSEAGVPLIAVPGRGYSLMDGYFLPPLSFSVDEATLLLLGADVMQQHFDEDYGTAAQWASSKIAGVLPPEVRENVAMVRDSIHFFVSTADAEPEIERLRLLRGAILRHQTVSFRYQARSKTESVFREADPYRLVSHDSTWYLSAYCHLRESMLTFRLSRIEGLALTTRRFERDKALMEQAVLGARLDETHTTTVCILFDLEAARMLREERLFFIDLLEETAEGIFATLRVRHLHDILYWVMRWGRHIIAIEPDELRQMVVEEALTMVSRLNDKD